MIQSRALIRHSSKYVGRFTQTKPFSSVRGSCTSSSKLFSVGLGFVAASIVGYTATSSSEFKFGELKQSSILGGPNFVQCKAVSYNSINNIAPTQEKKTGILFPKLCNGLTFVGCGVRVKYRFVKVYAVGTYIDPLAMNAVKKEEDSAIEKALLDPLYPRTIRIVMNRSLSIEKYTAAIVEALEPRMGGLDLDKLKQFQEMNPPGDLVEGAEMTMDIRGNTMMYRNSAGGVGAIHSETFCKALLSVYYGSDPVSPEHKEAVIKGIKEL